MSDSDIRIDKQAGQFETVVDGEHCVLEFTIDDDSKVISMDHVRVPEAVGGRGIAGRLTRHALDWADDQGLGVRANCPYVAAWIKRHPGYQRLLAD